MMHIQFNEISPFVLPCDERPTAQSKQKQSSPSEMTRILMPCLECLAPFLALKEVNALGGVNQAWSNKIFTKNTKKQPCYVDRKSSLLVYLYVQNLLRNSKTNPMTSARLFKLSSIGKSRGIKILPFLFTRYLHFSYKDYQRNILWQRMLRQIPCDPALQVWHPYVRLADRDFSVLFSDVPHYKQAIDEQVEGRGLAQLRKFTALHSLSVQGDFKDDELELMECLAGTLERLSVTSLFVTDIGLKNLAQLSALKELTLQTPIITAIGLNSLNRLTQLQSLRFVAYPNITASHIAQLANLIALQDLSFVDCGLDHIEGLGRFTWLRSLTLKNCNGITDDKLNYLNKLTLLQHLNLSVNSITSSGLAKLNGLISLQELMLEFTKVEDIHLCKLWNSHFPALKAVSMRRSFFPPPPGQHPSDTIYYAGEGLYIRNEPKVDEEVIKVWREHFCSIEKDVLRTFFM